MSTLKKGSIYNAILAMILSIATVFMTRTEFIGGVWGQKDLNHFGKFGISAIVLGIVLFFAFGIIIQFSEKYLTKFLSMIAGVEQREVCTRRVVGIWAAIIFVSWVPYYLSYYPGGVYSDTYASISYSFTNSLSNRHPFFYNLLIDWAIKFGEALGQDVTWSMGVFTLIQMLLIEVEFSFLVSWMLKHRINRKVRIGISLFFIYFPLIPLYAIAVWKDTPFCMAVLLWMLFLTDLHRELNKGEVRKKTLSGFVLGMFLVAFTRNNGIYVVAFVVFLLILTQMKRKYAGKRMLCIITTVSVVAIGLIQGPGYDAIGVERTETVESFGIPLQQIGAVVAWSGNITEEQKERLNCFIPYDNIADCYSPALVDNLKWNAGLNGQYLSEHSLEFLKLWAELLPKNISIYVKAYLMATLGFWNVDIASDDGYVQTQVWLDDYGLEGTDYFFEWFGFSFQHFVNPRSNISCAWFFWIFFVMTFYVMKHYGWREVFVFTPQLGIWLTLMIATPIAISLRYIAASMFTLPFVLLVPILLERESSCG